jgi:type IV pilus assembly protein PilW
MARLASKPVMAPTASNPVMARLLSKRLPGAAREPIRHRARGLSLVELLVGIALALLIIAGGVTLLTGNLREHRSLLLESRLMQDLRTAADVITRDVRRSGYWAAAADGVWTQGASAVASNPYSAVAPAAAASDNVSFRFSRDATENGSVDANEQFGFRLRNGALEMQLGAGNWQALTDSGSVTVTAFSVTPTTEQVELDAVCPVECPASSATCPPRLSVRSLALRITGRAVADAQVVRTVRSSARLRNDLVVGACAT